MIPSASDLTYFVEVAATQNLSRAAERLGISQPSLSLAIQRLEEAIGASLLVRGKRGVTLTQAGKQLLSRARSLLQSWESVRADALASVSEVRGIYTIGCHPSVALYSLQYFIPELLLKFPGLDLRLRHDLSRRIAEAVIQAEVDLGIVVNPVKHPDLVIRKLRTDEVTLWAGGKKSRLNDISSGSSVLICDPELGQTKEILGRLKRAGVRFARVISSPSLEVVASLVASGAGVGILPGCVAAQAPSRLRKLEGTPVYRDEIALVFRVESRAVRSVQAIASAIEGVLDNRAGLRHT